MILLAILAAFAAPRVDPGLAPEGVEEAFRAWAVGEGKTGPATEIVCRPFAEKVELCFTRAEKDARVYVTRADGKSVGELESAATGSAKDALAKMEAVKVEGFATPYWMRAEGDGRDHAAVLHPEALRAKLGEGFVVAAPARNVLVAWKAGDIVFDKIVAVGVRRMYETLPDPVSPLVYRWDGERWVTWGQAREVPGEAGPSPTPAPSPVPGAPRTPER